MCREIAIFAAKWFLTRVKHRVNGELVRCAKRFFAIRDFASKCSAHRRVLFPSRFLRRPMAIALMFLQIMSRIENRFAIFEFARESFFLLLFLIDLKFNLQVFESSIVVLTKFASRKILVLLNLLFAKAYAINGYESLEGPMLQVVKIVVSLELKFVGDAHTRDNFRVEAIATERYQIFHLHHEALIEGPPEEPFEASTRTCVDEELDGAMRISVGVVKVKVCPVDDDPFLYLKLHQIQWD